MSLSPEQIKALEPIVDEFNDKIFNVISEMERTKLELSLEFQREDRFVTKSKTTKSVKRANNLVKKLADLYGDLLKLEAAYVLKTKDVLTREQRRELIRQIDFDMEISADWSSSHEFEAMADELDLSEDQLQEIKSLMTELKKKEAESEQKMVALGHEL
ncbi:MAG: hypothetical protein JRE14_09780, partial [Deltaproteobacteria bacterium]|nr:hypothetical protein [Deltaproteobacteria bacterium]